jgi:hypothetical protein
MIGVRHCNTLLEGGYVTPEGGETPTPQRLGVLDGHQEKKNELKSPQQRN